MVNILGGEHGALSENLYGGYPHVLARDPRLKVHLYGKDVKPGARSATSRPTATTWTTYASGPGTPPPGSAATSGWRANERRRPAQVGIVMGSDSDWPTMKAAGEALEEFGVAFEADVVSAHRMPEEMLAYGKEAAGRGLQVIIAGAGGAAHLPGMLAAVTPLPVIGVPVALKLPRRHGLAALDRADARRRARSPPSPSATPATPACSPSASSAASDEGLREKMVEFQASLRDSAHEKGKAVRGEAGDGDGLPSSASRPAGAGCVRLQVRLPAPRHPRRRVA